MPFLANATDDANAVARSSIEAGCPATPGDGIEAEYPATPQDGAVGVGLIALIPVVPV